MRDDAADIDALVEQFEVPAYIVRADRDLTLAAWNHSAEQTFRRAAKEVVGSAAYELLRPDLDAAARQRRPRQLRERGWWIGLTTLLDRDGQPFTFDGVSWTLRRGEEVFYVTTLVGVELSANSGQIGCQTGNGYQRGNLCASGNAARLALAMTRSDLKKTIAANITLARETAVPYVSKGELARRIETDRHVIYRYENLGPHSRTPDHFDLLRIAAALGRTVDWFYEPHAGGAT